MAARLTIRGPDGVLRRAARVLDGVRRMLTDSERCKTACCGECYWLVTPCVGGPCDTGDGKGLPDGFYLACVSWCTDGQTPIAPGSVLLYGGLCWTVQEGTYTLDEIPDGATVFEPNAVFECLNSCGHALCPASFQFIHGRPCDDTDFDPDIDVVPYVLACQNAGCTILYLEGVGDVADGCWRFETAAAATEPPTNGHLLTEAAPAYGSCCKCLSENVSPSPCEITIVDGRECCCGGGSGECSCSGGGTKFSRSTVTSGPHIGNWDQQELSFSWSNPSGGVGVYNQTHTFTYFNASTGETTVRGPFHQSIPGGLYSCSPGCPAGSSIPISFNGCAVGFPHIGCTGGGTGTQCGGCTVTVDADCDSSSTSVACSQSVSVEGYECSITEHATCSSSFSLDDRRCTNGCSSTRPGQSFIASPTRRKRFRFAPRDAVTTPFADMRGLA